MFENINSAREEIKYNFEKENCKPWIVSYSGGKDSTLLSLLIIEVAINSSKKRDLYFIFSDTGIEQDGISERVEVNFKNLREYGNKTGLNIKTDIIKPSIDGKYFNCIVGRGYCSPYPPMIRWCTDRLKQTPIERWKKENFDCEYITLTGERFDESLHRKRSMTERLNEDGFYKDFVLKTDKNGNTKKKKLNSVNEHKYCPIRNVLSCELWKYLGTFDYFPWGEKLETLLNQYSASSIDEITKENKERRSGCRFCTFSKKKCISYNEIENEFCKRLSDYTEHDVEHRNLIYSNRLNTIYNIPRKLKNNAKILNGEIAVGSLTINDRKHVLEMVRQLEQETGKVWITKEDEEWCRSKWKEDEEKIKNDILVDARNVLVDTL